MDGIGRRLARLEGPGRGLPCKECGTSPAQKREFTFGGVQDQDAPMVTYCPGCGRVLRFTLDIGSAPYRT